MEAQEELRRCNGCVAAGNELALLTKGRERSAGDECPICSRLLPLSDSESTLHTCCMKTVCDGCDLVTRKRGMNDKCSFCRTPVADSDEKHLERIQKRVKANDPEAIRHLGVCYKNEINGLEKDMPRAVELFERAAELGSKEAHYELGVLFDEDMDDSGIAKDMVRAVEHYELAAMQGHAEARHNVGACEDDSGNHGLALKHWMISAKLGDSGSLDEIKYMHTKGQASKSDYAEALRGYHGAAKEMSSPERDEAKALRDKAKS